MPGSLVNTLAIHSLLGRTIQEPVLLKVHVELPDLVDEPEQVTDHVVALCSVRTEVKLNLLEQLPLDVVVIGRLEEGRRSPGGRR